MLVTIWPLHFCLAYRSQNQAEKATPPFCLCIKGPKRGRNGHMKTITVAGFYLQIEWTDQWRIHNGGGRIFCEGGFGWHLFGSNAKWQQKVQCFKSQNPKRKSDKIRGRKSQLGRLVMTMFVNTHSFSLTFFIFQCQVMDRFTTLYSSNVRTWWHFLHHHRGNIRYVSNIKWFSRLIILFMTTFKIVVF